MNHLRVSFKTLNIEVQCIESYNQTCLLVRDLEFSDIGYMKSNLNGGAVQGLLTCVRCIQYI